MTATSEGGGVTSRPLSIVARLHLYPPDHCAGAEMMTHTMLRELVARGHHCEVHLSHYSASREPYTLDGVQVFPAHARADLPAALRRCDVMVTHLDNTSACVSMSLQFGKPLVQILHNTFPPTRTWASCKAELLVYNSEHMRGELGNDPRGIVVRPPIAFDDYRTTPGHAVTLINLTQAKGAELFYKLAEHMPDVEFTGVIGGYGEQIIRKLPNVNIVPHGSRMRDVYAATKILLVPSEYESWGRVGGEAACSGIPVLAHPTPGLRESLAKGGTFLDRDDPAAWETEIRRLLDDPAHYARRSKAALKRAAELDPAEDLDRWAEAVERIA